MTILLGYARVSTDDSGLREQTLRQQFEALEDYGVPADSIFSDKGVSGSVNLKSGRGWLSLLEAVEEFLARGEEVEIVAFDWSRISRDFFAFLAAVNELAQRGVCFTMTSDSRFVRYRPLTSSDGLMLAIEAFGSQSMREKISASTKAKLASLKAQGVVLGRPKKLSSADLDRIRELRAEGFGYRKIAAKLSEERFAAIPSGLSHSERKRAVAHAEVSHALVRNVVRSFEREVLP